MGVRGDRVGPAVTLGLLVAWALHDAEELATGPRWISENLPTLRERFPGVPEPVWARGRLWKAGVLKPARARDVAMGLAVAAGATTVSHAVARRVVGSR
ncbi:HXXEE domain-containing protein [Streptomyces niveus]